MIHFRLGFMSAGRGWGEAADRQKGKEEAEKGGGEGKSGQRKGAGCGNSTTGKLPHEQFIHVMYACV